MPTEEDIRAVVRKVVAELDGGSPETGGAVAGSESIAIGADHGGFSLIRTCGSSKGERAIMSVGNHRRRRRNRLQYGC
jgi:hypothetical protein